MSTSFIFVVAYLALLCMASADNTPSFNAIDFFKGNWTVSKSFVHGTNFDPIPEVFHGKYRLVQDGDMRLVGVYAENDTVVTDFVSEMKVEIEFTSKMAGIFKTSASEDTLPSPLFAFEFRVSPTASGTSGVYLSIGEWFGSHKGKYQLVAHTNAVDAREALFALTVFPSDSKENVMTINAIKVPEAVPPTFWQNWGTTIMMIGMFTMQMIAKGKLKVGPQPREPAGAASPSAGARAKAE